MANEEQSLRAAEGYLQLAMPDDAIEELKTLSAARRCDVHALELTLAAEMMRMKWNAASDAARLLCRTRGAKNSYFIHAAYCLHETGDTLAAKELLQSGPKGLLKDALFYYNMGCYSAVLGQRSEARNYLKQAFDLDESLRESAREDEDLKGIL